MEGAARLAIKIYPAQYGRCVLQSGSAASEDIRRRGLEVGVAAQPPQPRSHLLVKTQYRRQVAIS
jgi:hypothetical protein